MAPDPVESESGDDSIDITLRPVDHLSARAIVLASVARRGMLEVEAGREPYELETDRFDLSSWVRTELDEYLLPTERRLLGTPIGDLSDVDFVLCQASLIGASTIAWTLSVAPESELPIPADGVAERLVLAWAPTPWDGWRSALKHAKARDLVEIANERERLELWYWRATDAADASEMLREVVADIRRSDLIPIRGDDFVTANSLAFSDLSSDSRSEIAHEAEQRLLSLNWVCGFGDSWDNVPLYPD